MFLQGEILKSKERTELYPKFVMVLYDKEPSETQFNGVVILCKSSLDELLHDEESGFIANNWNTSMWEKTTWEEVKKWI